MGTCIHCRRCPTSLWSPSVDSWAVVAALVVVLDHRISHLYVPVLRPMILLVVVVSDFENNNQYIVPTHRTFQKKKKNPIMELSIHKKGGGGQWRNGTAAFIGSTGRLVVVTKSRPVGSCSIRRREKKLARRRSSCIIVMQRWTIVCILLMKQSLVILPSWVPAVFYVTIQPLIMKKYSCKRYFPFQVTAIKAWIASTRCQTGRHWMMPLQWEASWCLPFTKSGAWLALFFCDREKSEIKETVTPLTWLLCGDAASIFCSGWCLSCPLPLVRCLTWRHINV